MGKQSLDGLPGKDFLRSLDPQKVLRQRDNILRPLTQWRNPQLKLPQPMKQILTEAALPHCSFQVLVGGRYNAHIHLDLAIAAQPVERLAIQHPQQLALRLHLQLAYFIKE